MAWLWHLIPYILAFQAGYQAGYEAGSHACLAPAPHVSRQKDAPYLLTRVVDGDTIYVKQGGVEYKLRLLRINTPERGKPGYKEATEALRGLLAAKKITLEDEQTGKIELDRYGRRLVYVLADGVNVNLEMMRLGWTPLYVKYGAGRLGADFEKAHLEAKDSRRGLWK